MKLAWVSLAMLAAGPYWEALPPAQWDEIQLRKFFVESPWAQPLRSAHDIMYERESSAYLASAAPVREAETELRRRTKPREDILWDEYRAWLDENVASHVVIAVRLPKAGVLDDAREAKAMEEDCSMRAGGRRYRVKLLFSPSATDPYVRLAFPRPKAVQGELEFELYLPGSGGAYRTAVFKVQELMWKGKPEM